MARLRFEQRVPQHGRIQHLGTFHPPGLAPRSVRVFLPRDYGLGEAHYALYLFDGQNVFGDHGSFAGGWHTHLVADRLARARKRAPVVIAVDHGGVDRLAELSPFATHRFKGEADKFLDWMTKILIPQMHKDFRLLEGPVGAVVGGSSMGGLAALYAHYARPEVFGGALCLSPSLWVGAPAIFDYVAQRPKPIISRVYLDCGVHEARGSMMTLAEKMAAALATKGYDRQHLRFRADPHGRHDERTWRRRLPAALRFMYQ